MLTREEIRKAVREEIRKAFNESQLADPTKTAKSLKNLSKQTEAEGDEDNV